MALVTPPVAMLNVPLPVIGPPVSPAPLATLVTVPAPLGVVQAQALPFHSNTWPLAQLVSRPRFSVPLVPPPVSPLPLAVVTPVRPPPANTMSNSDAWLVDVLSLLSNVALNVPLATSAMP